MKGEPVSVIQQLPLLLGHTRPTKKARGRTAKRDTIADAGK
jgi:hypothetical protein